MNAMNYDRKTLKERAKASLRGIQPRPWKVTLLAWLLVSLIPGIVTLILQLAGSSGIFAYLKDIYTDPAGWSMRIELMDADELLGYYARIVAPMAGAGLISTFITMLIRLFQLVMSYGYANYSLKLYRGEPTETRNIFSGFPLAGRAILTGIVTYIFEFLWSCLAAILGICATMILTVLMAALDGSTAMLVLGILLIIVTWVAVVIFSVFISYRYSLAPYFILTTDMGVMDAIRESKNAMRGNLGRRFMLDLSFIGWGLLNGLIVMGVVLVGYFILVFGLSFALIFQYADAADLAYLDESMMMSQIMGGVLVGGVILAVVAQIASLPIGLWLTAYRGSARAGFFLVVTGQDGGSAAPAPEYIPPQPSGIWDNVPTPPSFTPPAPTAPEAPEAPVTAEEAPTPAPEQPTEPEVKPEETPAKPEEADAPAAEQPAEAETKPEEAPTSEEAAPPTEEGEA